MSRDWCPDFPELTGVGEVYGASRNYNGRAANPNATGQHICGTADQWAGRAEYDPTANVQYNRDGIPLCCGAAELPRGGVLLGGRAAVGYTPPTTIPGADCSSAVEVPPNVVYTLPVREGEYFWIKSTFPLSSFVQAFLSDLPFVTQTDYYSGSCGSLTFLGQVLGNSGFVYVDGLTVLYARVKFFDFQIRGKWRVNATPQ